MYTYLPTPFNNILISIVDGILPYKMNITLLNRPDTILVLIALMFIQFKYSPSINNVEACNTFTLHGSLRLRAGFGF